MSTSPLALPDLATQPIDEVSVTTRTTSLATRSIKKESKLMALKLAINCMDLTTLEGADTSGKIADLCFKAMHPDYLNNSVPAVAAVCVYPDLALEAKKYLSQSSVKVAAVATGFPSGRTSLNIKLVEIQEFLNDIDELDMVIDRAAFLMGDYNAIFEEIVAVKNIIKSKHLKVILETGELGGLSQIRTASILAMEAGADFIKTSTGKIPQAANPNTALVMMEAVRDYADQTGRLVGIKLAGGIKTSKQAINYLVLLNETLGDSWLNNNLFRLGASSLLNDILMQIRKEDGGFYQTADDFSNG